MVANDSMQREGTIFILEACGNLVRAATCWQRIAKNNMRQSGYAKRSLSSDLSGDLRRVRIPLMLFLKIIGEVNDV